MNDEERAWLTLALAEGIGPRTAQRLLERLGDVRRAATAGLQDLRAVAGPVRGRALHEALAATRPDAVLRTCARLGQCVLTPGSAGWPAKGLDALADPPLVLFLRGRLPPADAPAAAVVGTRSAGPYGLRVAHELAEDLARAGVWVLSGLALGIDGAAHRGALAGARAGTLAVMGCGLDVAYPAEHLDLREAITEEGGLLSELPPGTRPAAGHFPRRNRIVAALAHAVVVVEAPTRSGSILTARIATELGREVLAVPGPIGRRTFRGSHLLLKRGEASLCEDAADVLAALGRDPVAIPASVRRSSATGAPGGRTDDTGGERHGAAERPRSPGRALPPSGPPLALWGVLGDDEILDPDELCRRTGLSASAVAVGLAQLELEGRIARVPGVGVRRLE